MKGKIFGLMVVAVALFVSTGGAWASVLINVQFNYYTPYDPGNPQVWDNGQDPPVLMDPGSSPIPEKWTPSYTGGAVIGAAGDIWNQLTDTESVNPTNYVDATGTPTGVTLTPSFHPVLQYGGFTVGPYTRLMSSFTYNPDPMTFNGLTPNTLYDLYIYTQGDTVGRTMTVSMNGVSATTTPADPLLNSLVADKNYIKITADSGVSGQLVISYLPGLGDTNEADINAIQLAEAPTVPEPSTYLLLCLSLGAVGFARKRMSRSAQ